MRRASGWSWRLLAALAALLVAAPAGAALVILQPGPEGEDTAPYQFIPTLPRGGHNTIYAFSDLGDQHDFEAFLRIALPPDLLGPDEAVGQALLSLYYALESTDFGETSDEPAVLECREVTSDWTEMGVTWVAKPSYGPPVDVVSGIDALGPIVCDVTELVQAWAAGTRPNRGIALTNPTARLLGFYSFEAAVDDSLRAALYVDVVPVPEPGAAAAASAAVAVLVACRWRQQGSPA